MTFLKVKFFVNESILIDWDKEKVWENITNPKKKNIWSPWTIMEKTVKQEYTWEIWKKWFMESREGEVLWTGTQEITEVKKNFFIKTQLKFLKPFKSSSDGEMKLSRVKGKTLVTWSMEWNLPVFLFFLKKIMSFFVWADFKRWLLMLKDFTETWKLETSTNFSGKTNLKEFYYVWLKDKTSFDEMPEVMAGHFEQMIKFLDENKIEWKGSFANYTNSDLVKNITNFESCTKILKRDYNKLSKKDLWQFIIWKIDWWEYIWTTHTWSYRYLFNSWTAIFNYAKAYKFKVNMKAKSLEFYKTWPQDKVSEEKYETEILVKLK